MRTVKMAIKVLAYIVAMVLAIPAVVVLGICAAVIYGALWLECEIVCDIWDDKLTDEWNKFVNMFGETMDAIKKWFIFEMELD